MKNTSETVIAVLLMLYFTVIHGESDNIVLIAPVLSPTSHVGDKVAETAKDFPVLMVLAGETNEITAEVPKKSYGDTLPIYVKNTNKAFNPLLQRIKRHALGLGEGRLHLPARVQSRAPTVIVVPERGTGALPAYSAGPISPYSVNTPNRGTTVVVSQVPEYNNYHTVGRSYDIMPINPMRI